MSDHKSLKVADVETAIRNMLNDNINYDPTSDTETAGNSWDSPTVMNGINFAVKEYCKKTKATYTISSVYPSTTVYTWNTPNSITIPLDNL